jgi:hypothetical protein
MPMIQMKSCEAARVEKQFYQLLRNEILRSSMARKLPEYRYRFALLNQLKEFYGAVWVTTSEQNEILQSSKVKLIA